MTDSNGSGFPQGGEKSGGLPAPLTPPDSDLTGFNDLLIDIPRLIDSQLLNFADAEAVRAALFLWCKAWLSVPAASLPDDDRDLMAIARLARAPDLWGRIREDALRGFVKCADGRLYHTTLAEKANEAWASRLSYRARAKAGGEAKARLRRASGKTQAKQKHASVVPKAEQKHASSAPQEQQGRASDMLNPAKVKLEGEGKKDSLSADADKRRSPDGESPLGAELIALPDTVQIAFKRYQALADRFGLVKPTYLTKKRRTALKNRFAEHKAASWETVLREIENSPGLRGENARGWRVDLDFIIKSENYIKLLEGKYREWGRRKEGGDGRPSDDDFKRAAAEAVARGRQSD